MPISKRTTIQETSLATSASGRLPFLSKCPYPYICWTTTTTCSILPKSISSSSLISITSNASVSPNIPFFHLSIYYAFKKAWTFRLWGHTAASIKIEGYQNNVDKGFRKWKRKIKTCLHRGARWISCRVTYRRQYQWYTSRHWRKKPGSTS